MVHRCNPDGLPAPVSRGEPGQNVAQLERLGSAFRTPCLGLTAVGAPRVAFGSACRTTGCAPRVAFGSACLGTPIRSTCTQRTQRTHSSSPRRGTEGRDTSTGGSAHDGTRSHSAESDTTSDTTQHRQDDRRTAGRDPHSRPQHTFGGCTDAYDAEGQYRSFEPSPARTDEHCSVAG